jgi:nitrogen fixation protein NifU and related proteins
MVDMTQDPKSLFLEDDDRDTLGEVDEETLNPTVIDHASRPRNMGRVPTPDGAAVLTGYCEDTVAISLAVRGDRITLARFEADGCGFTRACGSMATSMAVGRTISEALDISGETVTVALGGLPREHTHCAELAANTLKAAARDVLLNQNAPWQRLYRPSPHRGL